MKCLIRTEFQAVIVGFEIAFEIGYRLTVGMSVINAESTAHINVFDTYLTGFKFVQQFVDTITQSHKIAHIQYLRTDMEMQSDELDVFHLLRHVYHMVHIFHTDTELVFRQSGSDVGMRMRAYIGVDTESNIGYLAFGCGQFVDNFQFGYGLYIKAEDIIIQSKIYLPVCLTHSGKHNLVGRETSLDCRTDFTAAHTVRSQPALTDNSQNLRIGIGLYRIMHRIVIVS